MAHRRIVETVALALGLAFLIAFFLVSSPLVSSEVRPGPLQALARFFNPELKADPTQYLAGRVVRFAFGALALGWLASAAVPRGTIDATIQATLQLHAYWRRALIGLLLGVQVNGIGVLQSLALGGEVPNRIAGTSGFGMPMFWLGVVTSVLGLLVCLRLLFGLHPSANDRFLGLFAVFGAGIQLARAGWSAISILVAYPEAFGVISSGKLLFPALAVWAGILLIRRRSPLPGKAGRAGLIAYIVAGGITAAIGLNNADALHRFSIQARSIASADALIALGFLAFAAICLAHGAAMASMAAPAAPSPAPPQPTAAEVEPAEISAALAAAPNSFTFPWGLVFDTAVGLLASGALVGLTAGAVDALPLLIGFFVGPAMLLTGALGILAAAIIRHRFGYIAGAGLFVLGILLLNRF